MRKIYFPFIIASLLSWSLIAQPGTVRDTWGELVAKGDFLLAEGSYHAAADYYKKALEMNSDNADLKFKEAEALRMGRDYRRASFAYKSLHRKLVRGKLDKKEYPLVTYYYALMLKQSGEYEDAEEIFSEFTDEYDGSQGMEYLELAKLHYKGCKMARMGTPSKVEVQKVDALGKKVNSKFTESSAAVLEDGFIIYTSIKAEEPAKLEGQTAFSRIYTATIQNNRARQSEEVSIAIQGELTHVGSVSPSPDGEKLYLTICEQGAVLEMNCAIYVSTKNPEGDRYTWGRPKKLGGAVNMDGYQSSTPFVANEDGKEVLYFSSNRPGGQGGMDIWAATASGDTFENTINLGKTVNTPGKEVSPFLDNAEGYADPRPILYFSSDGHPGYGGLDIFLAYKNNVNYTDWADVTNAGKQLNSPADEASFALDPNKTTAFFVSNRIGGYSIAGRTCCDDVFMAKLEGPELEKIIVADFRGKLFDEDGGVRVGENYRLYDVTGGKRELMEESTTAKNGFKYENLPLDRDFSLEFSVDGYDPIIHKFSTKNLKDSKVFGQNFNLVKIPTSCSLSGTVTADRGSGGRFPLSAASVKITKIVDGKEELYQEVTTDAQGTFSATLPKGEKYRMVASKAGYLNASSPMSTLGAGRDCQKSMNLLVKEKRKDIAFKIENILYDFNSAQLRTESIPNLEVLLKILNDNPGIVIELGSHTDSKGTNTYNMELSQKRAQSVVDWLVGKGINPKRLVAMGYGESVPLVPNTNPDGSDNPENRQMNRRTEFKIIGEM